MFSIVRTVSQLVYTPAHHCVVSHLQETPVATSPTAAADDGLGLCNVCFVDPKEMINCPLDVQYIRDHENLKVLFLTCLVCLHMFY